MVMHRVPAPRIDGARGMSAIVASGGSRGHGHTTPSSWRSAAVPASWTAPVAAAMIVAERRARPRKTSTAVDKTLATVTETPMPALTIHVEPTAIGRWIVRHDNERESRSEHDSATDAQRVACDLAHIEGASVVLLHDARAWR
jgi:hypothetical protein